MRFFVRLSGLLIAIALVAGTGPAKANDIEFVNVGSPGNLPDDTGYGKVDYSYQISKFEITAGQYTEFLNAVASVGDAYGLYSPAMTAGAGCQIARTGAGTLADPYSYSITADRTNRPVNTLRWGDAARYCNWLTNGKPVGTQDASTTEDGSYTLVGTITELDLLSVTRNPDAIYAIPSEDEWYKAAYYDPGKPGGAGYWDYPTATDVEPGNLVVDPDPGNNVNGVRGYHAIGAPYYLTEVGEFENSASPFGTFDQGGNVWEWTEGVIPTKSHALRGSGFGGSTAWTHVSMMSWGPYEDEGTGFRIVMVPEPTSLSLSLDIKPGSCPNPLNLKSRGKLPVAVLGTEDFDVSLIDIASITIARAAGAGGSIAPYDGPPGPNSTLEDVGTPFDGELCECHELSGDGIEDLSFKFDRPAMVDALQLSELEPGATVELVVSGQLQDGTLFEASDCILIVPQPDFDEDNDVDQSDFGHFQACFRGPVKVVDWGCEDADVDGDGDVDISDFGRFQRCISGASKAVKPNCAD